MRSTKISRKLKSQIAKSREEALAAFVSKKAEIDAEMLKRVTDKAFQEGECAE